jgi:hypothetical protein
MKYIAPLLIILLFNSCGQNNKTSIDNSRQDTVRLDTITHSPDSAVWTTTKNLTVSTFLKVVRLKKDNHRELNIIVMKDDFDSGWVKRSDIDTLIQLVKLKDKCSCFLEPVSSFIPTDSANIGGYAIRLIKSYRDNKKLSLGLYSCPKTNDKEAEELIHWWASQH